MTINRSSITSQAISSNTESIIQVLEQRPRTEAVLDPPGIPGQLIGYYNGASGFVELYVVSGSGLNLLRI
jgi:hypothetical protein